MRRIFIALIVVMFVGGHGLSSAVLSFSQNSTAATLSHFNASADNSAALLADSIVAAVKNDECCAVVGEIQIDNTTGQPSDNVIGNFAESSPGSSHCTAHCGIDVVIFVADVPGGNWNLELPMELAYIAKTTSDHFRPPII